MTDERTSHTQMLMPIQAAPVDRSLQSAGAYGSEQGVEAAGFFDDLWHSVAPAIPGLASSVLGMI